MFDAQLFLAINGAIPGAVRTLLLCVTYLAGAPAIALWFALVAWLTRRDGFAVARKLGATLVFAAVSDLVLKTAFARVRPWRVLPAMVAGPLESDFSFPSGHATLAFALAASIAIRYPRLRWPVTIVALLVAFSRIAIGMHYPGDVLGGALLGVACALVVERASRERPRFGLHRE